MFEVDEAAKIITESVDRDANIIFGTTINDDYTWELKITVVATWFDEESNKSFSTTTSAAKMSPFGRKAVWESKPFNVPASQPRTVENSWDDLDVPAFLRKKI
jgi:cell division protein FtsZ